MLCLLIHYSNLLFKVAIRKTGKRTRQKVWVTAPSPDKLWVQFPMLLPKYKFNDTYITMLFWYNVNHIVPRTRAVNFYFDIMWTYSCECFQSGTSALVSVFVHSSTVTLSWLWPCLRICVSVVVRRDKSRSGIWKQAVSSRYHLFVSPINS